MSQFLCPTLVGRDDEVDVLDARLAEARAGRGGAVVLLGEAGSGKSRLVREGVRRAKKLGMRVVVGRAVDSPTPMAFRPLAEALASLLRETSSLVGRGVVAPYRSALGRIVPEWRQQGEGVVDSPLQVGEGLLQLLRALDCARGLLLVLEDLHWADPETLEAVEYLADNLADEAVACVLTTRPDAHDAVPERLGALVARGSTRLLETRPLSRHDVLRMAALSLGVDEPPPGLGDLLAHTEGLPLLVEEVLAAAADSGALRRASHGWEFAPASSPPVPVTVRGAVARRLGVLDRAERAVLGAAALLGRRFDVDLLGPVVGVDQDVVVAALRRCADLQLLILEAGDVRFRHTLTRDAVLDQMLRPERVELARSALSVLRVAHPELSDQRCELVAALHEQAGEPAAAAGLLLVTGRREHARGALSSATRVLDRARPLASPSMAVEIDQVLLRVLADAGRVDDAFVVGERLLAALPPQATADSSRVEAYLLLARAAVAAGRWRLARLQIGAARRATVGSAPRIDALAAQVELGCGAPDDAVDLAWRALEHAEQTEHAVRCEALEVLGRVARQRDVAHARKIFGEQLAAAEEGALTVWRLRALQQLGTLDLLAGPVLGPMRRARAVAVEQGALATAANIDLQIASNLCGGFRISECLQVVDRCIEVARRWRLGSILPVAQVVAASAHGIAGRRPLMEQMIAEALAGDVDDDLLVMVRGRCRGILALLDEDHSRALREFDAAMKLARLIPAPTLRPWFGVWAVLHALHDSDSGEQVRVEARRLTPLGARSVEALLDLADAVACGRNGDPAAATQLVTGADATLAGVAECMAGYHQLARRLLAQAALTDGWGEPVHWLTDAAGFFQQHGHQPVARACRGLLRRAGAPVPRRAPNGVQVPAGLRRFGVTEREHDVLLLVAAGRTSGQIADQLVISRRTVDKHVERLLAKTGARRRADLAGLIDDSRT